MSADLRKAAREVVRCWEHGNLAGAVRMLDLALKIEARTTTKHYVIVGRIPDQENVAAVFQADDLTDALKRFELLLYADWHQTPEEVKAEHGDRYLTVAIIECDTKPTITA